MGAAEAAEATAAPASMTVGLLFDAWDELDWLLAGLSPEELIEPWGGGSAFAWTYGHTANSVDAWINVRFAGHPPLPIIGAANLRFGGDGRADDWPAIEAGVRDVRARAWAYLHDLAEPDLNLVIPYDGSIASLRPYGLSLRFAILTGANHFAFHNGEIATKRERLGRRASDSPIWGRAMLSAVAKR